MMTATGLASAQAAAGSESASEPPSAESASPAAPDPCPEKDATACGRRHFEAGAAAFERGDFQLAASEFRAAMTQRPHPVIRFNLGLSLARLGKPLAAIEELSQVQADPRSDAPLRARAERERKSAQQALAHVSFRLSDPARERVELDGQQPVLGPSGELELDPGSHHVRVISGNSVVLDQDLELSPSERVELRVGERSRRIDVVVVPTTERRVFETPRPLRQPGSPRERGRPLSPLWFYAAAGTSVVLGGLTIWSALDTQSAFDDYQRDLPRLTQAQADSRVDDGHARELRTNLLLAGSLLSGAGTLALGLLWVDFGSSKSASLALSPSRVALRTTW